MEARSHLLIGSNVKLYLHGEKDIRQCSRKHSSGTCMFLHCCITGIRVLAMINGLFLIIQFQVPLLCNILSLLKTGFSLIWHYVHNLCI